MRFEPRQIVMGLVIAGTAGAALLLPAIALVGTLLAPSQPVPATRRIPALLADAMWARANGGRATELQPLNPFSIAQTAACHLLAERFDERTEREAQHDACMTLLPGVQAVGYLSSLHMRGEGVWQDPRVPFVQIATMAKITGTWTKAELLDTLAERGEFGVGFIGAEAAATGYFGRSPDRLTLTQAALIAALMGDGRIDPWCDPVAAAGLRRQVLERLREHAVIDEAAYRAATATELGLTTPPADHKSCDG